MNSHDLTLAGYGAFIAAGIALELAARRPGAGLPTLGALLSSAMDSRPGRVGVVVGWAWVGFHFLVR